MSCAMRSTLCWRASGPRRTALRRSGAPLTAFPKRSSGLRSPLRRRHAPRAGYSARFRQLLQHAFGQSLDDFVLERTRFSFLGAFPTPQDAVRHGIQNAISNLAEAPFFGALLPRPAVEVFLELVFKIGGGFCGRLLNLRRPLLKARLQATDDKPCLFRSLGDARLRFHGARYTGLG